MGETLEAPGHRSGAPGPPLWGPAWDAGELLWYIVRHIPRAKAQGLDAWAPDDLKALPREAYDDLAAVLTLVEAEGSWPEGLSGAIVALLPCLLYTSPSPRDVEEARMPSSA